MNISEIFIRRPVMTTLIMAGVLIFGVMAYRLLPVSDLPNVDFPTIQVSATLPGASPETMASSVATPLEKQFSTIAGLDNMSSSSSQGSTQITLQFNLSRNLDGAALDVQSAISAAGRQLPPNMPAPPTYGKVNPADQPVLYLTLTSKVLPLSQLDEYGEVMMAQRISTVSGVAQVQVYGPQKYAVRIQADPRELASRGIGIDDVAAAVTNANVNLPTGILYGPVTSFTVQANGQLFDASGYRPIIVAYRNGSPVRLDDVANVVDGVENDKAAAWYNDERSISLAIFKQPGTNTVAVAEAVRKLLPTFQKQLPAAASLHILYDRSASIRDSVNDVKFTLLLTLVLVVLVIFLFLRKLSATVIPSLALPFSIVGTFAVMYVMGYSLDNLSLMALTLSVGFVVDDAIVMLENIVRHMEMGKPRMQAALDGAAEVGFTILSMTFSLAAVFIPILFMSGILGRLFREFAVTITTAILISGVVSVTLTPMLCSRFLRVVHSKRGFAGLMDRAFDGLLHAYEWSLGHVLRHRIAMLLVFAGVLGATVRMAYIIPTGFIPDQDNDSLFVNLQAAQGTSYYDMAKWVQQVADIVIKNPYVDSFQAGVGGGPGGGGPGGGGANGGNLFVQLTPRATRDKSAQQIAQEIRPQLLRFPGFRGFVRLPPSLQIGGRMGNQNFSIMMQSLDTEELYRWAPRLEAAIAAEVPEIQDPSNDVEMRSPRVNVVINRDKAAMVGLNATTVQNAMYDALGPKWATTIYGDTAQYRVLLELDPKHQGQVDSLEKVAFKAPSGALVPLQSVIDFKETVGPQSINHSGQLPSVSVSFGLKPGVSLGTATAHVKQVADRLLPATITTSFEGQAKVFQQSMNNLGLLLFIAIGVVYIVLGALYESYIHPITILSGLPSAGLGALVTLYLFGNELNIYSFVGLVMLIGIVKKNAIMQIDFALDAERKHGKTPTEAIYEGCIIRFRPIMMTTMAALLGSVPIALGYGAGGEARRPLGLAVVGGLVVSQLITLYLTPVVYTYMAAMFKTRRIPQTATA